MRIALKNLPESTKESEIRSEFSKHGTITDIFMLKNGRGVFRRVCFIGYMTEIEAKAAVEYRHNSMFKNHKLTVEMATEQSIQQNTTNCISTERKILYSKTIFIKGLSKEIDECCLRVVLEKFGKITELIFSKNDSKSEPSVNASVTFKDGNDAVKASKLKIIAGRRVKIGSFVETIKSNKKEYFNTLFFNFETVLKRTCEIEKIDKKELINLKDKDLGAKMALLETNLVEQTKKFLEYNKIYLNQIDQNELSETKLILRNSDIIGCIDLIKGDFKVNIAPSKCLAILEFKKQKDAVENQKILNLKRHKNQVIYCEFAPQCTNKDNKDSEDNRSIKKINGTNKLVVKNVPFQATDEEIKKIFSTFANVKDVRIPKKSDGSHRGFCFIVLDSSESVELAIEYFGVSTHLYGRKLVLERAKL